MVYAKVFMKIIIATGIYPPQIGGPATYAASLAQEITTAGHDVTVVTYGEGESNDKWAVEYVSMSLPIVRWFLYAKKLRSVGSDADVVYALSSVSCGVPLVLSGLKNPKRVLRLGGDFLWERYTDWGGTKSLRDFYTSFVLGKWVMQWILNRFCHVVFSTEFQQKIYQKSYRKLPKHSVIENALDIHNTRYKIQDTSRPHIPFRLLFMGRTVKFKNILSLVDAVAQLPDTVLTIVGDGPLDHALRKKVEHLGLDQRVRFVAPVSGKEKGEMFTSHDLLVLPSYTDISPNTALEASATGMPILLTQETGLSTDLLLGMNTADMRTPGHIVAAITDVRTHYAPTEQTSLQQRSWKSVSDDHEALFGTL